MNGVNLLNNASRHYTQKKEHGQYFALHKVFEKLSALRLRSRCSWTIIKSNICLLKDCTIPF
ncbi:hypothetical protein BLOT_000589 [Blomia tropicalis]|nr:hypothetical protein BLOT_000589 [Blomia tropicalis]